ncbi:hypothetical protein PF005_g29263 [Phytophthora fragariae]|uniref:Uncharacterized protein n=2 Tax=Phytophthora fragariae TaxID=53985 RepID=A0A6A3VIG2_9STRA|nr:hypothetical protein PF005_g29263 [Phytophthora fragariae]
MHGPRSRTPPRTRTVPRTRTAPQTQTAPTPRAASAAPRTARGSQTQTAPRTRNVSAATRGSSNADSTRFTNTNFFTATSGTGNTDHEHEPSHQHELRQQHHGQHEVPEHELLPAELSAPEYWSAWYRRTLAASEEAKRANRDFKAPATAAASTPRVGAVQPDWSDGLKAEENELISEEVMNVSVMEPNESPPEPVTDERLVAGNICVAFSGSEVEDPPQEDPVKIPFRLRSLIRTVVYQIVLEEEARSVPRCPACLEADTSPSDDSSSSASARLYSIVEREARARLLTLVAAGVLGDRMMEAVIKQIMEATPTTTGSRGGRE